MATNATNYLALGGIRRQSKPYMGLEVQLRNSLVFDPAPSNTPPTAVIDANTNWVDALRTLQLSSLGDVDSAALEATLEFRESFLPNFVRSQLGLLPAGLYFGLLCIPEAQYTRRIQAAKQEPLSFWREIKKGPFVLWAGNLAGAHWIGVVLYLEETQKGSGRFDRVVQYAMNNSSQSIEEATSVTNNYVDTQLIRVLAEDGITVAPGAKQPMFTPRQRNNWACGIYTYKFLHVMMQRIEKYITEPSYGIDVLWEDIIQRWNPDELRLEMAGLCAARGLTDATINYHARIAVERVTQPSIPPATVITPLLSRKRKRQPSGGGGEADKGQQENNNSSQSSQQQGNKKISPSHLEGWSVCQQRANVQNQLFFGLQNNNAPEDIVEYPASAFRTSPMLLSDYYAMPTNANNQYPRNLMDWVNAFFDKRVAAAREDDDLADNN